MATLSQLARDDALTNYLRDLSRSAVQRAASRGSRYLTAGDLMELEPVRALVEHGDIPEDAPAFEALDAILRASERLEESSPLEGRTLRDVTRHVVEASREAGLPLLPETPETPVRALKEFGVGLGSSLAAVGDIPSALTLGAIPTASGYAERGLRRLLGADPYEIAPDRAEPRGFWRTVADVLTARDPFETAGVAGSALGSLAGVRLGASAIGRAGRALQETSAPPLQRLGRLLTRPEVAAGVSEGAQSAAQTIEQIEQESERRGETAGLAPRLMGLGSGAMVGAIAQTPLPGIGRYLDPEIPVTPRLLDPTRSAGGMQALGRALRGALIREPLEEVAQAVPETVSVNIAAGRAPTEGLAEQAGLGAAGAVLGGAGLAPLTARAGMRAELLRPVRIEYERELGPKAKQFRSNFEREFERRAASLGLSEPESLAMRNSMAREYVQDYLSQAKPDDPLRALDQEQLQKLLMPDQKRAASELAGSVIGVTQPGDQRLSLAKQLSALAVARSLDPTNSMVSRAYEDINRRLVELVAEQPDVVEVPPQLEIGARRNEVEQLGKRMRQAQRLGALSERLAGMFPTLQSIARMAPRVQPATGQDALRQMEERAMALSQMSEKRQQAEQSKAQSVNRVNQLARQLTQLMRSASAVDRTTLENDIRQGRVPELKQLQNASPELLRALRDKHLVDAAQQVSTILDQARRVRVSNAGEYKGIADLGSDIAVILQAGAEPKSKVQNRVLERLQRSLDEWRIYETEAQNVATGAIPPVQGQPAQPVPETKADTGIAVREGQDRAITETAQPQPFAPATTEPAPATSVGLESAAVSPGQPTALEPAAAEATAAPARSSSTPQPTQPEAAQTTPQRPSPAVSVAGAIAALESAAQQSTAIRWINIGRLEEYSAFADAVAQYTTDRNVQSTGLATLADAAKIIVSIARSMRDAIRGSVTGPAPEWFDRTLFYDRDVAIAVANAFEKLYETQYASALRESQPQLHGIMLEVIASIKRAADANARLPDPFSIIRTVNALIKRAQRQATIRKEERIKRKLKFVGGLRRYTERLQIARQSTFERLFVKRSADDLLADVFIRPETILEQWMPTARPDDRNASFLAFVLEATRAAAAQTYLATEKGTDASLAAKKAADDLLAKFVQLRGIYGSAASIMTQNVAVLRQLYLGKNVQDSSVANVLGFFNQAAIALKGRVFGLPTAFFNFERDAATGSLKAIPMLDLAELPAVAVYRPETLRTDYDAKLDAIARWLGASTEADIAKIKDAQRNLDQLHDNRDWLRWFEAAAIGLNSFLGSELGAGYEASEIADAAAEARAFFTKLKHIFSRQKKRAADQDPPLIRLNTSSGRISAQLPANDTVVSGSALASKFQYQVGANLPERIVSRKPDEKADAYTFNGQAFYQWALLKRASLIGMENAFQDANSANLDGISREDVDTLDALENVMLGLVFGPRLQAVYGATWDRMPASYQGQVRWLTREALAGKQLAINMSIVSPFHYEILHEIRMLRLARCGVIVEGSPYNHIAQAVQSNPAHPLALPDYFNPAKDGAVFIISKTIDKNTGAIVFPELVRTKTTGKNEAGQTITHASFTVTHVDDAHHAKVLREFAADLRRDNVDGYNDITAAAVNALPTVSTLPEGKTVVEVPAKARQGDSFKLMRSLSVVVLKSLGFSKDDVIGLTFHSADTIAVYYANDALQQVFVQRIGGMSLQIRSLVAYALAARQRGSDLHAAAADIFKNLDQASIRLLAPAAAQLNYTASSAGVAQSLSSRISELVAKEQEPAVAGQQATAELDVAQMASAAGVTVAMPLYALLPQLNGKVKLEVVNLSDIQPVDPDIPENNRFRQIKVAGTNPTGAYDFAEAAPIWLLRARDGKLHLITGRHRLDAVKRTYGQSPNTSIAIPAFVVEESSGLADEVVQLVDWLSNYRSHKLGSYDMYQFLQHLSALQKHGRQDVREAALGVYNGIVAELLGSKNAPASHIYPEALVALKVWQSDWPQQAKTLWALAAKEDAASIKLNRKSRTVKMTAQEVFEAMQLLRQALDTEVAEKRVRADQVPAAMTEFAEALAVNARNDLVTHASVQSMASNVLIRAIGRSGVVASDQLAFAFGDNSEELEREIAAIIQERVRDLGMRMSLLNNVLRVFKSGKAGRSAALENIGVKLAGSTDEAADLMRKFPNATVLTISSLGRSDKEIIQELEAQVESLKAELYRYTSGSILLKPFEQGAVNKDYKAIVDQALERLRARRTTPKQVTGVQTADRDARADRSLIRWFRQAIEQIGRVLGFIRVTEPGWLPGSGISREDYDAALTQQRDAVEQLVLFLRSSGYDVPDADRIFQSLKRIATAARQKFPHLSQDDLMAMIHAALAHAGRMSDAEIDVAIDRLSSLQPDRIQELMITRPPAANAGESLALAVAVMVGMEMMDSSDVRGLIRLLQSGLIHYLPNARFAFLSDAIAQKLGATNVRGVGLYGMVGDYALDPDVTVIMLGRNASVATLEHELWHAASRYLSDEDAMIIERERIRAIASEIAKLEEQIAGDVSQSESLRRTVEILRALADRSRASADKIAMLKQANLLQRYYHLIDADEYFVATAMHASLMMPGLNYEARGVFGRAILGLLRLLRWFEIRRNNDRLSAIVETLLSGKSSARQTSFLAERVAQQPMRRHALQSLEFRTRKTTADPDIGRLAAKAEAAVLQPAAEEIENILYRNELVEQYRKVMQSLRDAGKPIEHFTNLITIQARINSAELTRDQKTPVTPEFYAAAVAAIRESYPPESVAPEVDRLERAMVYTAVLRDIAYKYNTMRSLEELNELLGDPDRNDGAAYRLAEFYRSRASDPALRQSERAFYETAAAYANARIEELKEKRQKLQAINLAASMGNWIRLGEIDAPGIRKWQRELFETFNLKEIDDYGAFTLGLAISRRRFETEYEEYYGARRALQDPRLSEIVERTDRLGGVNAMTEMALQIREVIYNRGGDDLAERGVAAAFIHTYFQWVSRLRAMENEVALDINQIDQEINDTIARLNDRTARYDSATLVAETLDALLQSDDEGEEYQMFKALAKMKAELGAYTAALTQLFDFVAIVQGKLGQYDPTFAHTLLRTIVFNSVQAYEQNQPQLIRSLREQAKRSIAVYDPAAAEQYEIPVSDEVLMLLGRVFSELKDGVGVESWEYFVDLVADSILQQMMMRSAPVQLWQALQEMAEDPQLAQKRMMRWRWLAVHHGKAIGSLQRKLRTLTIQRHALALTRSVLHVLIESATAPDGIVRDLLREAEGIVHLGRQMVFITLTTGERHAPTLKLVGYDYPVREQGVLSRRSVAAVVLDAARDFGDADALRRVYDWFKATESAVLSHIEAETLNDTEVLNAWEPGLYHGLLSAMNTYGMVLYDRLLNPDSFIKGDLAWVDPNWVELLGLKVPIFLTMIRGVGAAQGMGRMLLARSMNAWADKLRAGRALVARFRPRIAAARVAALESHPELVNLQDYNEKVFYPLAAQARTWSRPPREGDILFTGFRVTRADLVLLDTVAELQIAFRKEVTERIPKTAYVATGGTARLGVPIGIRFVEAGKEYFRRSGAAGIYSLARYPSRLREFAAALREARLQETLRTGNERAMLSGLDIIDMDREHRVLAFWNRHPQELASLVWMAKWTEREDVDIEISDRLWRALRSLHDSLTETGEVSRIRSLTLDDIYRAAVQFYAIDLGDRAEDAPIMAANDLAAMLNSIAENVARDVDVPDTPTHATTPTIAESALNEFTKPAGKVRFPLSIYSTHGPTDSDLLVMSASAAAPEAVELEKALRFALEEVEHELEQYDKAERDAIRGDAVARQRIDEWVGQGGDPRKLRAKARVLRRLYNDYERLLNAMRNAETILGSAAFGMLINSLLSNPIVGLRNINFGQMMVLFLTSFLADIPMRIAVKNAIVNAPKTVALLARDVARAAMRAPRHVKEIYGLAKRHKEQTGSGWIDALRWLGTPEGIQEVIDLTQAVVDASLKDTPRGFIRSAYLEQRQPIIAELLEVLSEGIENWRNRERSMPRRVLSLIPGIPAKAIGKGLRAAATELYDVWINTLAIKAAMDMEQVLLDAALQAKTAQELDQQTLFRSLIYGDEAKRHRTAAKITEILQKAGINWRVLVERAATQPDIGQIMSASRSLLTDDEFRRVVTVIAAEINLGDVTSRPLSTRASAWVGVVSALMNYSFTFAGQAANLMSLPHKSIDAMARLVYRTKALAACVALGIALGQLTAWQSRQIAKHFMDRTLPYLTMLDTAFWDFDIYNKDQVAFRVRHLAAQTFATYAFFGDILLGMLQETVGNRGWIENRILLLNMLGSFTRAIGGAIEGFPDPILMRASGIYELSQIMPKIVQPNPLVIIFPEYQTANAYNDAITIVRTYLRASGAEVQPREQTRGRRAIHPTFIAMMEILHGARTQNDSMVIQGWQRLVAIHESMGATDPVASAMQTFQWYDLFRRAGFGRVPTDTEVMYVYRQLAKRPEEMQLISEIIQAYDVAASKLGIKPTREEATALLPGRVTDPDLKTFKDEPEFESRRKRIVPGLPATVVR